MKDVQCYELFGGIALRNLAFSFFFIFHTDFGLTDAVLQWSSSYLTDRTHYISLPNHCSVFAPVHSGVAQGSVLDFMLFTLHIKPLSAIIDSHYHTPFIC